MNKDIKNTVLKTLSEYLGVELEDISEEDSFEHDLHMNASNISDFLETLSLHGLETDKVNIVEVETIADLIDALGGETYAE